MELSLPIAIIVEKLKPPTIKYMVINLTFSVISTIVVQIIGVTTITKTNCIYSSFKQHTYIFGITIHNSYQ